VLNLLKTRKPRIFVSLNKLLRFALSQVSVITGKRLGKNVISETNNAIRQYSNVLDILMQNFRDQVARDVAIHVHRTGKRLDVLVT
jgi:hypothetical protein